MPDDRDDKADHLDGGRSLAAFAREEVSGRYWSIIDIGADGSITPGLPGFVVRLGADAPPLPPGPTPSPAFVAAIAALRTGRRRLLAEGDHTLGNAKVAVPLGLLRGKYRIHAPRAEAAAYLREVDPYNKEVGPIYYRPVFAPAEEQQPVIGHQAPAGEGKPPPAAGARKARKKTAAPKAAETPRVV